MPASVFDIQSIDLRGATDADYDEPQHVEERHAP